MPPSQDESKKHKLFSVHVQVLGVVYIDPNVKNIEHNFRRKPKEIFEKHSELDKLNMAKLLEDLKPNYIKPVKSARNLQT